MRPCKMRGKIRAEAACLCQLVPEERRHRSQTHCAQIAHGREGLRKIESVVTEGAVQHTFRQNSVWQNACT